MLILTRREGESIYIGSDIIVQVLSGLGRQTKLGITAPSNIHILREELIEDPRKKTPKKKRDNLLKLLQS